MSHLANTLDRLLVRTLALKNSGDPFDLALFGPFLGRATMEVAFTAILGRFDPFRVLAIRKSQTSAWYDSKHKNPLAFNWAHDVRGDDKPKDWEQQPSTKDLQRALLCKHFNDVFWQEAFMRMLDDTPAHKGSEWMTQLKRLPPEGFTQSMRSSADRIYSELSKGIHHEFVIPPEAKYDCSTVSDLIVSCWELVAALGLTACFSPTLLALQPSDPLTLYEAVQEELYPG